MQRKYIKMLTEQGVHSSMRQLKHSSTAEQLPKEPGGQVETQVIKPPLMKNTPLRLSMSSSLAVISIFVSDALLSEAKVIAP
jgi:hypothetical protein